MNPVLAKIYGTSLNKTASSNEELDLSQLSAAELMQLLQDVEEEEAGSTVEKMASDGSFDYFDMAGRVMAHAYADEMSKVASSYDADEIDVDLNSISGDQLLELMDAGYEFVDSTKTAASRVNALGEAIADRVGFLRRGRGSAGALKAKELRALAFQKGRKDFPGVGAKEVKEMTDDSSYAAQHRGARMAEGRYNRRVGQGAIGIGALGVGGAGVAAGAGAYKMRKKSEK